MVDEYLIPGESLKRLFEDYQKHGSLVVAFDFDNTIYDFHKKGHDYPLVINLLKELNEIGCWLICFTASQDTKGIERYMTFKGIPCHGINENPPFFKSESRKIYFNALLDDRAGLIQVYNDLSTLVYLVKKLKV